MNFILLLPVVLGLVQALAERQPESGRLVDLGEFPPAIDGMRLRHNRDLAAQQDRIEEINLLMQELVEVHQDRERRRAQENAALMEQIERWRRLALARNGKTPVTDVLIISLAVVLLWVFIQIFVFAVGARLRS